MHPGYEPILRANHGKRIAAQIAAAARGRDPRAAGGHEALRLAPRSGGPLAPLTWDAGGPWSLELEIARGGGRGRATVTGRLVRGDERLEPGRSWRPPGRDRDRRRRARVRSAGG